MRQSDGNDPIRNSGISLFQEMDLFSISFYNFADKAI